MSKKFIYCSDELKDSQSYDEQYKVLEYYSDTETILLKKNVHVELIRVFPLTASAFRDIMTTIDI